MSYNSVLIGNIFLDKGDYSKAKYTVTALDRDPVKSLIVLTQTDPQDAEPDDEFGFSETITDWPDTL